MNRAWHLILATTLCATAACALKSATSTPPPVPAALPHLALNTPPTAAAPPAGVQTAGVQTAEAPAIKPSPVVPEEEPGQVQEKAAATHEDLPLPHVVAGGLLPRLPAGDPRRGSGKVLPSHPEEEVAAKEEKTEEADKGPIVQTKIVGGEQHLRFESGEALTQLVKGGALQLIAFVSVAGTGRHYAYSESAGLLPMPEAAYTALVEQGRVLEMPPDPTVREELKVGDSQQYTIAVGDAIEHRLATALADASGGATRSIAVVDETGNVRVALARR